MNDAGVATVDDFKLALGTMINTVGTRVSVDHIFLMTMNPAISPASSGTIAGVPEIYQGLRDLATARGTGLIDNHPLWTSPTTTDITDGIHPTMAALLSYGVIDNIVDGLSPGL